MAYEWMFGVALLSFAGWGVQRGSGLTCYCNNAPGVCPSNSTTCSSSRVSQCFIHQKVVNGVEVLQYGCHFPLGGGALSDELFCTLNTSEARRSCCRENLCNLNLTFPPLLTSITPTSVISGGLSSQNTFYRQVTIAVPICSALILIVIIVAMPTILFLLRRRKLRIERLRRRGQDAREPSPVYSPYSLDTLDLEGMTCTSGSGSGAPLLIQRTIARSIKVGEAIGIGRFGQVYVGEYQGDQVAVKKFASRDEKSWFRETEVYSTVLLRHDNILGYMASDIFSHDGVTELWLVTQFHPHGSLFDYLNQHTVSPKIMMRMAITICSGLTHLHTEVIGTSPKPSIAHRDIKSKNILVKNNLECCIGDFGLAVIAGPSSSVNFPTNPKQGTKRYMAPEILSETINMKDIEAFQRADIYAFGLVLWELCKRCAHKNDTIGDYEPPFHGKVGPDPSFEEMRKVVVTDRQQPTIPAHWRYDDLLHEMAVVLKECWYFDSSARNDALFFKLKLVELAREDKIEYDVQE